MYNLPRSPNYKYSFSDTPKNHAFAFRNAFFTDVCTYTLIPVIYVCCFVTWVLLHCYDRCLGCDFDSQADFEGVDVSKWVGTGL